MMAMRASCRMERKRIILWAIKLCRRSTEQSPPRREKLPRWKIRKNTTKPFPPANGLARAIRGHLESC